MVYVFDFDSTRAAAGISRGGRVCTDRRPMMTAMSLVGYSVAPEKLVGSCSADPRWPWWATRPSAGSVTESHRWRRTLRSVWVCFSVLSQHHCHDAQNTEQSLRDARLF